MIPPPFGATRANACSASGDVSMGTSIVAVSYGSGDDTGVILGADSRTSTGTYIANRVADKITPITDNVYCLRSGSASDTQAILQYVQLYAAQYQAQADEKIQVKVAAKLCQGIAYPNKDNLQAGMIVAGWDEHEGGSVWGVNLGGTTLKSSFATGGSGSAYIYGFCDKFWKDNMTEVEAKAFVVRALGHAMARDASSGGCIRTVTLNKDGMCRDFIPGTDVPLCYDDMPRGGVVRAVA